MNKFLLRNIVMSGLILLLLVSVGIGIGFAYHQVVNRTIYNSFKDNESASPSPTPTPSPTPSPSPSPLPSPTPAPTPKPKKQTSAQPTSTSCSEFKPENGQVSLRVNLVLRSGTSVVGRTVVRVKPTGTCPTESGAVEHWMEGGEMSWTTPGLNPGRYRIEVANGNYQGVIAETHNLVQGGYEITIGIDGQ